LILSCNPFAESTEVLTAADTDLSQYLSARLVDKLHTDYHHIDIHGTQYHIEFENKSDRDILEYSGKLKIFDIVGKEIAKLIIVVDDSVIKAKSKTIYKSETLLNDASPNDIKVRVQGVEDLSFKWVPASIVVNKA